MDQGAKVGLITLGVLGVGYVLLSRPTQSDETQAGMDSQGSYIEGSGSNDYISKLLGNLGLPNVYNITYNQTPTTTTDTSSGLLDTKKSADVSTQSLMSAVSTSVADPSTGGYINYDAQGRGSSSAYSTKKSSNSSSSNSSALNNFQKAATTAYGIPTATSKTSYNASTGTGTNAQGQGYSSAFDLDTKKKKATTSSKPYGL